MRRLSVLSDWASPYPGLRPFQSNEAVIFFGREEHVDHILDKLGQNHFLAVMGPSGCGKSSLMLAGVIPALQTGFLADAGAEWRIARMRPGNHPMERLAESLLDDAALGPERAGTTAAAAVLQATLLRGPLGLVEVLRGTPLPEGANLLLLVDQFEEIFRFRQQGYNSEAEADAFVELLLATAAQREASVYVVLTMRSDFLGDCALFRNLPEAINDSQFLTPRLTRVQQRAAIEGPASVFGGTVEAALVNALLNDMGPDPDQLPLMQHALMRMWTQKKNTSAYTQAGDKDVQEASITLTLTDYEKVGGLKEALSRHADEVFENKLDKRQQETTEVLFRCLSERSLERRDTRRPVPVSTVAAVARVSWQQVRDVVEVFRHPDQSFLTYSPVDIALHPETILDISHESLIRQWGRMRDWVNDEAESAETYRHLERTARLWCARQRQKDYLWRGHELELALHWRAQQSPTRIWAERYHVASDTADANAQEEKAKRQQEEAAQAFDLAMTFLDSSAQEEEAKRQQEEEAKRQQEEAKRQQEEARRQQEEAAQRQKLQQTRLLAYSVLVVLLVVAAFGLVFWIQRDQAQHERDRAQAAKTEADARRLLAEARSRPDESGVLLALQALDMKPNARMQHQIDETLGEILATAHFSHPLPDPKIEGVRVVAYSPRDTRDDSQSSRWLAVAVRPRDKDDEETVRLWDLTDLKARPKPLRHKDASTLAFSPNGRFLASAGQNICLWDLPTVEQSAKPEPSFCYSSEDKEVFPKEHGSVLTLAFGPGDRRLVSGSSTGAVQVWDVQDQDSAKPTLAKPILLGKKHKDPAPAVQAVAFSPDGKWVASGGRDKQVLLWDVDKARQQGEKYSPLPLAGHDSWVTSVAFTDVPRDTDVAFADDLPDAPCRRQYVLASGSADATVRLWDMSPLLTSADVPKLANKPCQTLRVEGGGIWAIAFSSDSKFLASAGEDRTVRLWDWNKPTPFPTILRGHDGLVMTLAFSPDRRWIASGGFDQTVRLWEMDSPYILRGHENSIQAVAFSPRDDHLTVVSGGLDNTVRLWKGRETNAPSMPPGFSNSFASNKHTDWVWAVAFSPDGTTFASGSFDTCVRLWNADSLDSNPNPFMALPHDSWVTAVQFSPKSDHPLLVTAERGISTTAVASEVFGRVRLWDMAALKQHIPGESSTSSCNSLEPLLQFPTNPGGTWSVAFSHDGDRFVTGGGDGSLKLWGIEEVLAQLSIQPQGQKVPAESSVKLWGHVKHHDNAVLAVAFSPDDRTIASGSLDATIHLRGVDSFHGAPIILKGHKGWVWDVAFSPDGQWLASGGSDGTVRLWNVKKVREQAILEPDAIMRGHESMVRSVAFSPDGQWLISGGGDKTLRLWRVQKEGRQTETLRAEACARVWYNLSKQEWEDIVQAGNAQPEQYRRTCENLPPHPSIQPPSSTQPHLAVPPEE